MKKNQDIYEIENPLINGGKKIIARIPEHEIVNFEELGDGAGPMQVALVMAFKYCPNFYERVVGYTTSKKGIGKMMSEAAEKVLPMLNVRQPEMQDTYTFYESKILHLKKPKQCVFWKSPELVYGAMKDHFELIDTYEKDSHLWRYLLKCRECGQLYFFEFYEEIDWINGNDPQYSTWIPVETNKEIEVLKKTSQLGLMNFFPRIQKDFPKDAKEPTLRWVKK